MTSRERARTKDANQYPKIPVRVTLVSICIPTFRGHELPHYQSQESGTHAQARRTLPCCQSREQACGTWNGQENGGELQHRVHTDARDRPGCEIIGWVGIGGHGWNFLGQPSINKCALDLLFKHYTQIYTSARATPFEQKLRMGVDKRIRVNSLCASVLCLVRCGVTLYALVFSRMRYHCVRFVLKCRTTLSLLLNQQLTQSGSSRNFSKIGPAPKPL